MLSRIQNIIKAGDQKINDIQVRCNKLPNIFIDMILHKVELELTDDTDHKGYRVLFVNQS